MKEVTVKYSEIRQKLKLGAKIPKVDDNVAAVTHYLQSQNNGAKSL